MGGWYKNVVGEKGHYYHQKIILPGILRLLKLQANQKLLDLGCGQGVLGKCLTNHNLFWGLDLSDNLISMAKTEDKNRNHKYFVGDATKTINTDEKFDWITMILAIQNMSKPFLVFKSCSNLLTEKGKLLIVMNHPTFRIPQNSDWGVDKERLIQYRRIDRYMSPLEIGIEVSPFDKKTDEKTLSFHYPISAYSEMLFDNGFMIEKIEEWVSDKKSTGSMAKVEDRARREFPLFMAIVACRRQDKTRKFPEEQNL
ncbi:MAG: class I SAM-dependent methyltransferase [Candidatus Shapirobacteria bacterium]